MRKIKLGGKAKMDKTSPTQTQTKAMGHAFYVSPGMGLKRNKNNTTCLIYSTLD
jgi:transketolase N-terminal domain/subunit